MNQDIFISVIIPVYNAEKFIGQCIESILKQTYTNYELIIVDDGSTDMTEHICIEYLLKNQNIKYFKKENGGPFQTRIFGIQHAKGNYIMFCDADDYYATSTAFNTIVNVINKNNISMLQFGYKKKYNHLYQNCIITKHKQYIERDVFFKDEYPQLLCGLWDKSHLKNSVWNKVYSKKLFDSMPSYETVEKIFWGEDLILNLHALEFCESVAYIPDVLYVYRELSGGTNKFYKTAMYDLDRIKKYQLHFIERRSSEEIDKKIIYRNLFGEIAAWVFVWIQQALQEIDEKELKIIMDSVLSLPSFKKAQEYFINNTQEKWLAVDLLRKYDADEYIRVAKEHNLTHKVGIKNQIITFAKELYRKI